MATARNAGNTESYEVRAKVAHTEPGTQAYRAAGERFTHVGKLYKHVEAVKAAPDPAEDTGEEEWPAITTGTAR